MIGSSKFIGERCSVNVVLIFIARPPLCFALRASQDLSSAVKSKQDAPGGFTEGGLFVEDVYLSESLSAPTESAPARWNDHGQF